jgi:hypothetical protein
MKSALCLILLSATAFVAPAQQDSWYNTDSLLTILAKNDKIHQVLIAAEMIYNHTGLDTANISLAAFKVAYLEKRLIDQRAIRIKHRHRYRNKKIITVIDYTKKGNAMRFATIDLANQRLLYDSLVSQGSGKNDTRNDKFHVPVFFGNVVNSEVSSLGLMATKKARQTDNPCHLCKYAATVRHKDVIILEGLEKGINDNVKKRDIVIHTTGSKDFSDAASKEELNINDPNYRVAENECKCYHTYDDGKVKGIAAYASACGLTENNGYIGQSNGCLVLPEDHHVEIMEKIKRKSLIFIYSNVISDGTNYFENSPIIKKIIRFATR